MEKVTAVRRESKMIHLIIGGSGSGKSAYAERQAMETSGTRYYIATMEPFGEEGKRRIEKHRAMRAGKGFQTIECCHHLEQVKLGKTAAESAKDSVALLECMTNLAANEQFAVGGKDEEILDRIWKGIHSLEQQTKLLIIVTGDVFADGLSYDEQTERYLRLLGRVNRELAQRAESVTEVVYGIPVPVLRKQKGAEGKHES